MNRNYRTLAGSLVLALICAFAFPTAAQDPFCIFGMDATQVIGDPPVDSSATGTASFTELDNDNVELTVEHNVSNPTYAYIQSGASGENGGIVINLNAPESPIIIELTPGEYNPIASEPHYIIIQSSDFPSGEIRGQIVP